ncbi:hypothetical protein RRG08_045553 [Elysia crispata]|uniref:Uncharacterized protein n=1 Tax=Elysia crispata TaxID=231223 RepID=A0AAE1DWV1_9GAST|nr:hypothetical protein RRG08_045553 [Elysia crispata]
MMSNNWIGENRWLNQYSIQQYNSTAIQVPYSKQTGLPPRLLAPGHSRRSSGFIEPLAPLSWSCTKVGPTRPTPLCTICIYLAISTSASKRITIRISLLHPPNSLCI